MAGNNVMVPVTGRTIGEASDFSIVVGNAVVLQLMYSPLNPLFMWLKHSQCC